MNKLREFCHRMQALVEQSMERFDADRSGRLEFDEFFFMLQCNPWRCVASLTFHNPFGPSLPQVLTPSEAPAGAAASTSAAEACAASFQARSSREVRREARSGTRIPSRKEEYLQVCTALHALFSKSRAGCVETSQTAIQRGHPLWFLV